MSTPTQEFDQLENIQNQAYKKFPLPRITIKKLLLRLLKELPKENLASYDLIIKELADRCQKLVDHPEAEWKRAIYNNEPWAVRKLMTESEQPITSLCLKKNLNMEDVREIHQEAMVRVLEKINQHYPIENTLLGYVYGTARFIILDSYKPKNKEVQTDPMLIKTDHADKQDFYDEYVFVEEARVLAVQKKCQRLAREEILLLNFKYLAGLKYTEILVAMDGTFPTELPAHERTQLRLLSIDEKLLLIIERYLKKNDEINQHVLHHVIKGCFPEEEDGYIKGMIKSHMVTNESIISRTQRYLMDHFEPERLKQMVGSLRAAMHYLKSTLRTK